MQNESYRYIHPIGLEKDSEKWVKFLRDVIRTCIGCRGKFPQKTLIRFVSQGDKTLQIDGEKKLAGRGAYVCPSHSCIQKAFSAPKRINSLLRAQLTRGVVERFKHVLLERTRKSTSSTGKKEEPL